MAMSSLLLESRPYWILSDLMRTLYLIPKNSFDSKSVQSVLSIKTNYFSFKKFELFSEFYNTMTKVIFYHRNQQESVLKLFEKIVLCLYKLKKLKK